METMVSRNSRSASCEVESSEIPWEEVLNGLVEVLKELKKELKVISLFQVKHITVGFAEGDLIVIK